MLEGEVSKREERRVHRSEESATSGKAFIREQSFREFVVISFLDDLLDNWSSNSVSGHFNRAEVFNSEF